jgi:hypothetical protein
MADKNTVELEVIDQLHISSVSADTMPAGTRFTVSADAAKDLIDRGLACARQQEGAGARQQAPLTAATAGSVSRIAAQ